MKTPVVFVYVEKFMLKVSPVKAEVTVMVPLADEHLGWVTEAVGAAGVEGCVLRVKDKALDIHPFELRAVKLYVPAANPEKTPVVLV